MRFVIFVRPKSFAVHPASLRESRRQPLDRGRRHERTLLTLPMAVLRRFTQLTNAFSKKVQNLEAAVALHLMYYNFARIHQTLRVTPAMQAGIADHVWSIEDIAGLLD
jgi:hypothetical protein